MTLSPYALDDVCVWLLADDAYSDGGKIYCTRMYIGLTVSGVEQDIIEAPQTLAATDGTFEFDPANPQEQAGYTSMPQTYYGINGFSADSAAGCEYYTIGRRGEQDGFYLSPLGHTGERWHAHSGRRIHAPAGAALRGVHYLDMPGGGKLRRLAPAAGGA